MFLGRLLAPVLIVAGLALLVWSVLHGGATLNLVLIIPVLTGSSGPFLIGVLLLILGVFLLPLAVLQREIPHRGALAPAGGSTARATPQEASGGGLLLVGPVPIFFGSWRNRSRSAYWIAFLAGLALVAWTVTVLVFSLR